MENKASSDSSGRKARMQLEKQDLQSTQVTYIALDATILPLGKIPIAAQSEPQKICGVARRIGYAGTSSNNPPLYRLKIDTTRPTLKITLPGYFVFAQGIFREYQQE